MRQRFKKRLILFFVVAVVLMFLISACQDGIIGKGGRAGKPKGGGGGGGGSPPSPCSPDYDGDGYRYARAGCTGLDCDDGDPNVNPSATEICDIDIHAYQDDNCNGLIDEGLDPITDGPGCCVDNDGDYCGDNCRWNHMIYVIASEACDWDCDDDDPNAYPGNRELCGDGVDNDCDGLIDETALEGPYQLPGCITECLDYDGDGYGQGCALGPDCFANWGYTSASHYPGAPDVCGDDFYDTNCDGIDGSVEVCGDKVDNDCDGLKDDKDEQGCIVLAPPCVSGEFRVTSNSMHQEGATIDGDVIVWFDYRDGSSYNGYGDIYMCTIGVNCGEFDAKTALTTGAPGRNWPEISGNKIVWQEVGGLYVYDIDAGTSTLLASSTGWYDIDGDNVVAVQADGIHVYSISAGTDTPIVPNYDRPGWPEISIHGDKVVYDDERMTYVDTNGNTRNRNYVFMWDLSTGTETQVAPEAVVAKGYQVDPAVYGDVIVWDDNREDGTWSGESALYKSNPETTLYTPIYGSQVYPAIHGNTLVWMDSGDNGWEIFMKDLSTGVETQITNDMSWWADMYPDVFGDRIVWHADRGGGNGRDIFMYQICP